MGVQYKHSPWELLGSLAWSILVWQGHWETMDQAVGPGIPCTVVSVRLTKVAHDPAPLRAWLLPVHTNSQAGDLASFPRPKSSSCQPEIP